MTWTNRQSDKQSFFARNQNNEKINHNNISNKSNNNNNNSHKNSNNHSSGDKSHNRVRATSVVRSKEQIVKKNQIEFAMMSRKLSRCKHTSVQPCK